MSMNLIIQQKRRELGITQDQVAQYLGVSTPAVSKWEKGITCPDISLIPQLARLLKTDLNTLFCFHEELSPQEISDFCKALNVTKEEKGVPEAFAQADEMVRSYPHNELLLQMVTMSLDGMLIFSSLPDEEVDTLAKKLESWFHRLTESPDSHIRNTAHYMLASRYIRSGDWEKAQDALDQMPDKNDVQSEYADKLLLQVNIYTKQKKPELASQELEKALLPAVNKVQMLLLKLVDSEMAAGEIAKAEHIAKVSQDMVQLFDLWEGSGYPALLSVATEQKDKEKALPLLNGMLSAALKPWNYGESALYHRIPGAAAYTMDRGIISGMLMELSQDPQYDFLRDDERFQSNLAYYYYASVYQGDLGSQKINNAIGAWINNNTGGFLKKSASNVNLSPDTILALYSTIYFQAKWQDEFSESKNTQDTFHAPNGDITATFMNKKLAQMNYYYGDKFSAVALGLKNGSRMWFILPDEGYTTADVLADGQYMQMVLQQDWENEKWMKVNLSVPKFDVNSTMDLKGGLQEMGVTDVFNEGAANFNEITGDVPIFLTAANQSVRVQIDEEGVKAAAYIEFPGATSPMPPEEIIDFVLDRPFIFAITTENIPLFIGTVNSP